MSSSPDSGQIESVGDSSSSTSTSVPPKQPDRIDEIMAALEDPTLDTLPDHLRGLKYEDGFDMDRLDEQLQSHPFFMTELPDPSKPLPPLLDALQQLKYSEGENTNHELAINHKEDGLYHFKLKKYRIATTCYTTAMSYELKSDEVDKELIANLYNNRSACSWFIGNYRSCIKDCEEALKYKPGYSKALKRAIAAAEKLGRWQEMEKYCKIGEEAAGADKELMKFYLEQRKNAKRGKVKEDVKERKMKMEEEKTGKVRETLLEAAKKRGIKAKDWGFLESEAAQNGRVVKFSEENGEDGRKKLCWPVLLMYPEYSDSDFIEAFEEDDTLAVHLYEMLDADQPAWDKKSEYKLDTVQVYYLGDKLIKLDVNMTLGDLLKEEWFALPCNGVPSFFVLCNNQFCKDFVERIEVY